MSLILYFPLVKGFAADGITPLNGGLLYSYATGGTTPKNTYSNRTLATPNANPLVLNSIGEGIMYLDGATKLVLKTSAGVQVDSVDYVGPAAVEASAADLNTGTERNEFLSPYAFRQSNYASRLVCIKLIPDDYALTTGDGKAYWTVPAELNGWNINTVAAHVYVVSSSGLPTFQIHNLTDAQDILNTRITIDVGEKDSSTAAAAAVINTSYDDLATGDEIRFDVDVAGTGTIGAEIRLGLVRP